MLSKQQVERRELVGFTAVLIGLGLVWVYFGHANWPPASRRNVLALLYCTTILGSAYLESAFRKLPFAQLVGGLISRAVLLTGLLYTCFF